MKTTFIYKSVLALTVIAATVPVLTGCSEEIDESNLYTFTGETIQDFINNEERFSNFDYILHRAGMSDLMSGYGTYTVFLPTNDAVTAYVDSLYDDMSKKELPHNGMTARSLEGLTDSLCTDIARFHIASTEVMGVDMSGGVTIATMLGRDLNTSIDKSGATCVNTYSQITSMDNQVENGVIHVVNNVLRRSNRLIAGEMEQSGRFRIWSEALQRTGLADTLTRQKRANINAVSNNTSNYWVPEECKEGYTVFAETDEVLKENGIENFEQLAAYANSVYEHCADQGTGWYDHLRNHNIKVSTGNDYENPYNCLNLFLRYHIVPYAMAMSKLVYDYNQISKVYLYEYYQTLMPFTMMKVIQSKDDGSLLLNRYTTNSTLTDTRAEQGNNHEVVAGHEGVRIVDEDLQALNGYIHPITRMLIYDKEVPQGVLNERMRMDFTSLFSEMMSNGIRGMKKAEIAARAPFGYTDARVRFPSNYFDNLRVYNGDDTQLLYLPKDEGMYPNFQGDEFLCIGAYDFAVKMPPVPDGTYEIRIGYTAETARGMLQIYLGTSSEKSSMKAVDIPLDMRLWGTDPNIGWTNYLAEEDLGVQTDKQMRNRGYMRGPIYYTHGYGSAETARMWQRNLRRIVVRQKLSQDEYWLRFKTVLPENTATQFHLDYLEICPSTVYNNPTYAEDMY